MTIRSICSIYLDRMKLNRKPMNRCIWRKMTRCWGGDSARQSADHCHRYEYSTKARSHCKHSHCLLSLSNIRYAWTDNLIRCQGRLIISFQLAIIDLGCHCTRSAHGLIGCVCVDKELNLSCSHSPLWHSKTELALKESKLPYKRFEIDLKNKPEWYAPKVNSASKVRIAITRGKCRTDKGWP